MDMDKSILNKMEEEIKQHKLFLEFIQEFSKMMEEGN